MPKPVRLADLMDFGIEMKKLVLILSLSLLTFSTAFADAQSDVTARLKDQLAKLIPGQSPSSIKPSVIDGLYEVAYGAQIFYITEDGKYLIQGDILDLKNRKSVTQQAARKGRAEVIAKIRDEDTILYKPKGETKHTITVFTDIDCPYCRKLHKEREAYNKAGIAIRYLLYPRAGVGSPSYDKAVAVWCAKDRAKALTEAKINNKVDMKTCDNPVKEHLQLGEEVGVSGTPAILLEDGTLIPGYRPAADMAHMFAQRDARAKSN